MCKDGTVNEFDTLTGSQINGPKKVSFTLFNRSLSESQGGNLEGEYGRWHWNSLLNLQVSHGKRSRFEDKKQSLCTDLSKEIPCGKSYLIELK